MLTNLEQLKFPIGRFMMPLNVSSEKIAHEIKILETFPQRLQTATETLSDIQLDTPYRPGGWTIRQVVHHCSDSHLNSYIRFKWTLTEDVPTIKPYFEEKWAELPDGKMPIKPALDLLQALHIKWVFLLKRLSANDLQKTYLHPDGNIIYTLAQAIALYAWHCEHHLAHITSLCEREGWK